MIMHALKIQCYNDPPSRLPECQVSVLEMTPCTHSDQSWDYLIRGEDDGYVYGGKGSRHEVYSSRKDGGRVIDREAYTQRQGRGKKKAEREVVCCEMHPRLLLNS